MRQAQSQIEPLFTIAPGPVRLHRRPSDARGRLRRTIASLAPTGFVYLGVLVDSASIIGAAYASRVLYGLVTLGILPDVESVTSVGAIVALLATLSTMQRGGYGLGQFATTSGQVSRALSIWNIAFVGALALGFATKTSSEFSRGAVFLLSRGVRRFRRRPPHARRRRALDAPDGADAAPPRRRDRIGGLPDDDAGSGRSSSRSRRGGF